MGFAEYKSDSEGKMWEIPAPEIFNTLGEDASGKYLSGDKRIVTETNREKLPNFVSSLDKPNYFQVRPFYQRRKRWDTKRASKLIESFIMNIPVPPLFVYEKDYNFYEVMDGQQRISSLYSFYNDEFKLKGLELWSELNGCKYSELPLEVRKGLDRRSISYTVVLRESTQNEEEAMFLRHTVFERLNTGGIELSAQEIRNCILQSDFNNLLIELSRYDIFRWSMGLPYFSEEEELGRGKITQYRMYQKMEDVELILRFFALRHVEHYTKGMKGFLDLYMARAKNFNDSDIDYLRTLFYRTIYLAYQIYGDLAFRPFSTKNMQWEKKPQKAFWDSVMVGLSNFLDYEGYLKYRSDIITEKTKELFLNNPEGTFTGRGNSKKDVEERLTKFRDMLYQCINE